MRIILDDDILAKYGYTVEEFLLLLYYRLKSSTDEVRDSLLIKEEGHLTMNPVTKKVFMSKELKNKLANILLECTIPVNSDKWYENIATKLQEIYPKGTKPGTIYPWRGSKAEIIKKLQTLKVKYNFDFTEEQAIKATKTYVESFNGDYNYMKLLKYFILKLDKIDGGTDMKSDFMSYIENIDNLNQKSNEWTNTLC